MKKISYFIIKVLCFFSVLSQRENPNYAYLTHQINIQNPNDNLLVSRPDRAQSHKAFLINASRREWEGEGRERGIFLLSDQQETIIWQTRLDLLFVFHLHAILSL